MDKASQAPGKSWETSLGSKKKKIEVVQILLLQFCHPKEQKFKREIILI